MRISEFSSPDALLLFFYSSAAFQSELRGPLDRVIWDVGFGIWEHQLQQSAHRFLRGGRVASTQCSAENGCVLEVC